MGYIVLRKQLQIKNIPLRVVASRCNIHINRIYELTSKESDGKFTDKEIDSIYDYFFRDNCTKTKEELFKHEIVRYEEPTHIPNRHRK